MSLQEHKTCILSIGFALFVAYTVNKSFHCAKNWGLFSSIFKKIIHNNTIPPFEEVGGVT